MLVPSHTGPLLPATGTAGFGFTSTVTLSFVLQPFNEAVTIYLPECEGRALVMDGFCVDEV
jgi:hypothetical protein